MSKDSQKSYFKKVISYVPNEFINQQNIEF